jgi:diacylglycerol O-acyltransferase
MRQLTTLDVQFLALEDGRNFGHVGSLGIYDPSERAGGDLTLDDLTHLFEERIHLLPPLRWRLAEVPFGLDLPYWAEDADFDLSYHLRDIALPAPGDSQQLAEQVARIHGRPLDRSHPLWELYLIHGLADGRVGIFTKIHHAAVDGMSGAEILSVLLDLTPTGREIPPPSGDAGPEAPSPWQMLARGLSGLPRQPLRALQALPRTLQHLDANPFLRTIPWTGTVEALTRLVPGLGDGGGDGGVLERPTTRAPRTVFNGPISGHRRVSLVSLPLSEVKRVKNHFGVTVNDVVVTLCAGAVRRWLLEYDELPENDLVAMVPLSVRTPEQFGTFGNKVSAMMAPIPTSEPNPARRLSAAHAVLASMKTRHKGVPATVLQDSTAFIPPQVMARASRVTLTLLARLPVEPLLNVIISNVPGSPLPLYCAGAKLEAIYPISAIADSAGLNITVLSYQASLDFGIVADREQMPDAWPIAGFLRDALDELLALLPPTTVDLTAAEPVIDLTATPDSGHTRAPAPRKGKPRATGRAPGKAAPGKAVQGKADRAAEAAGQA